MTISITDSDLVGYFEKWPKNILPEIGSKKFLETWSKHVNV